MKHEIFDTTMNVSDTDVTFEEIYKKPYVPVEYMEDIKNANLLIIPNEGFRDEGDVLFPETTREFLEFLKDNANDVELEYKTENSNRGSSLPNLCHRTILS